MCFIVDIFEDLVEAAAKNISYQLRRKWPDLLFPFFSLIDFSFLIVGSRLVDWGLKHIVIVVFNSLTFQNDMNHTILRRKVHSKKFLDRTDFVCTKWKNCRSFFDCAGCC